MFDRKSILVPAFLTAQAVIVYWAAGAERLPAPPDLAHFPRIFHHWGEFREDPIEPAVQQVLAADRLLSRTYLHAPETTVAQLLVAWFQSQRGGQSQPHSPKVCLPGSGWIPEATGEVTISTAAGPIRVNRYIVTNRGQRAVVLYWYQTPRRVVAGEWEAKFWLAADSLRDKRSDTALVRIVVWSGSKGDSAATASAEDFAQAVYPLLRVRLPR